MSAPPEVAVIGAGVAGLAWLVCGGLIYTGGILFYIYDFRPHWHGIWHLFVLAGSATHYAAIVLFVA